MSKIVKVGMADFQATDSEGILTTLGLGSCVGVCLYDKVNRIAGMAHIMLPSSIGVRDTANPAKFADTGICALIELMVKIGADRTRLNAKLAGGAQMFSFSGSSNALLKIGERNVAAVMEKLNELKINIIAMDTGGSCGRTIELNGATGMLLIRTIGSGIKEI